MIFVYLLIALILFLSAVICSDKIKRRQITKEYGKRTDKRGKFADIEGIKVYYIEAGRGFPLVIIHGFMSCSIDFSEVVDELSEKFKVFAVDLIGFGRSDKREELNYSKKNMAETVHKLMLSRGYNKYNVLGHSMGGGVALNLAHNHPLSINSLILVDSVGYVYTKRPPVPAFILEHIFKLYLLQKLCYKVCFYNKKYINRDKFDRVYNFNCGIPGKTLFNFSRHDDSETIEGNICGIKCSALIIWGRHDKVTPLENAYKFQRDIAGSSLVIFEESGHLPYIEEENKFICTVERYLTIQ